jgi:hypothetical protein
MAIVAFVLGLAAIALAYSYFVFFALGFALGAILLGSLAVRSPAHKRLAIAAITAGGVGLGVAACYLSLIGYL